MWSVIKSALSGRSMTSRAYAIVGCRREISPTCTGCTNIPRTLADWSARPSQPRMRWPVRPHGLGSGKSADKAPVAKRISG
jgi:hypothetical protein